MQTIVATRRRCCYISITVNLRRKTGICAAFLRKGHQEIMIKNENYIVINGFMINDLKLKGNELIIFAIIYGFSQEENNVFSGSLSYLEKWTNSTRKTVIAALKSLCEKGYILKTEYLKSNIKLCEYRVNHAIFEGSVKNTLLVEKVPEGSGKITRGVVEKFPEGSVKITHNNIYNNIKDNINIKDKPARHKYGEYKNVLLSDEELEKLKNEFPNDYNKRIDNLSFYLKSTGKSYKSHLATLRNWARRDKLKTQQQQDNKKQFVAGDLPF